VFNLLDASNHSVCVVDEVMYIFDVMDMFI